MAVFATRAPSPLRKHAGAMNMYMGWRQVTGHDPFPTLEQKTWNYCSFLKGTCAPATRADSFIKAARVTIQLLSMKASSWDTGSDRIEGTVVQCLDTKRVLQHAVPMTVRQVEQHRGDHLRQISTSWKTHRGRICPILCGRPPGAL